MNTISRRSVVTGAIAATALSSACADISKVVMTGHMGNIGTRLFPHLAATGIDKKNGMYQDLGVFGEWRRMLDNADTVVHLAAETARQKNAEVIFYNNFIATANLISARADAGVRKIVFASSGTVAPTSYGYPPEQYGRNDDLPPYGRSKVFGENLLREAVTSGMLRSAIVIRIGWAPPDDTPPLNNWSDAIRVQANELLQEFRRTLTYDIVGYQIVKMIKEVVPGMSPQCGVDVRSIDPRKERLK